MGQIVKLSHNTFYSYDRPITLGPQLIRLRPAPHSRTPILSYSLRVEPEPHFLNWLQDPYGNYLARVLFPQKVELFKVYVDLVADLQIFNPFDFFLEPECDQWPFDFTPAMAKDLSPYLNPAPKTPALEDFIHSLPTITGQTIDVLVAINQYISQEITYNIRLEPNTQSPEDTLRLGRGSCRDSTLLLVETLRNLGFPARFVSGYLLQLVPDRKPIEGPTGPDNDFTDLHAWAEVYIPGAGWVGLDPTSGLLAGEGHIPLAGTPQPGSAAPIEGVLEFCQTEFHHYMEILRVSNPPRAEKPIINQDQATLLHGTGMAVDARLSALGFSLTIGGEPTFVAEKHREDPEWNTEAMGERKLSYAQDLLQRLQKRWAPKGLAHVAQGKWYPGESLPRWSLSCWWSKSGKTLWKNPRLLANQGSNLAYTHEEARHFMKTLTQVLGVNPEFIIEAYEDPLYFMIQERNLPPNLEPGDKRLAITEERMRLTRALSHGLDTPTGFVLPLQKGSWKSGPWPTRAGRLVLIPGDSPVGLRLPLDSLPWAEEGEDVQWYPQDAFGPFAPWGFSPARPPRKPQPRSWNAQASPLGTAINRESNTKPDHDLQESQIKLSQHQSSSDTKPQEVVEQPLPSTDPVLIPGESAAWVVRTALTVEARGGNIYIFFPPMRTSADWFALAEEIEKTAELCGYSVILEGYTPPYDPDIQGLQITPDPGVIEVNLPPAGTWDQWYQMLTDLWEEARACGLSTVKYLVGGQETATGGGCHWVLGGPTPAESPFLRRPDLVRSWITYLNHHPSLSYSFAGLFIGATSQAPRVDESNPGIHQDLELAFIELEGAKDIPPWLTDRIFRNLLVDGTGNTHRTEMCIDKLYSPDRPSGRLGLVEFRAFEMAVHQDTALSQSLMLRALTLWFLEQPYEQPLIRWGNQLKDRWMLPSFLKQDLAQVLDDLNRAGLPLPREPFEAHWDFKFPRIGSFTFGDVQVELRTALEPWPVLGEEGGAGGTVRYVDSSVERIQVLVTGINLATHALVCDGTLLPLEEVEPGVWVAGIRFKAWMLPASLHPTLEQKDRIIIDLYDRISGSVVAGCTYFTSHPAGRNYETPPVNEFEAEARRSARFQPRGHTPGILEIFPQQSYSKEFPHTLDTRI
jgi:uncharacterized protein (DUF2126 family)/transglutaminase-like putative cysteine protease